MRRHVRRAVVMRGIVAPIFGLIAVACVVFGALNAVVWKPSRDISARAQVSGAQYVTTDPGVLSLVDSSVRVTVESDASQADGKTTVCVALGSGKDVAGWVAGHAHERITGLSDWRTLSTQPAAAQGEDSSSDDDVAFKDSDLWTAVQCGEQSVTLRAADLKSGNDTVALIDGGNDQASLTVTMHWVRQNPPDFATPLYFLGGLFAVLAVLCASVFAMEPQRRRKQTAEDSTGETGQEQQEVALGEAVAGSLSGVTKGIAGIGSLVNPKSRHTRHRHAGPGSANHHAGADAQDAAPVIIDPSRRNMLASQSAAQGDAAVAQDALDTPSIRRQESSAGQGGAQVEEAVETSVISRQELQDYFARLAQELPPDKEETTPEGESTASAEESPSEESLSEHISEGAAAAVSEITPDAGGERQSESDSATRPGAAETDADGDAVISDVRSDTVQAQEDQAGEAGEADDATGNDDGPKADGEGDSQ